MANWSRPACRCPAEREGVARGYLIVGGDCPGGAEPVVKVVDGMGGRSNRSRGGEVVVNGKRLAEQRHGGAGQRRATRLAHVVVGQAPVWQWIRFGCWGLNNRRSWDSRYFGPVPLRAVRGRRGNQYSLGDRDGRRGPGMAESRDSGSTHLANLGGLVALAGLDTRAARLFARSVAEHCPRGGRYSPLEQRWKSQRWDRLSSTNGRAGKRAWTSWNPGASSSTD